VKSSKRSILSRVFKIPELRFDDCENQSLTSFSGLVTYQHLFQRLELKKRLELCFISQDNSPIYSHHLMVLFLIVHLSLGYRRLRDIDYYKEDPMVKRTLGLNQLPDPSTTSRFLKQVDDDSTDRLRELSKEIVLQRLEQLKLSRITLDFDGSVLSTSRHAQGTAVGFNKKKKGHRSYYPLFCTVAQTGQFLDIFHRPGNVHDSNGAIDFAGVMVDNIREILPQAKLEARMDSAFFSEEQLDEWNDHSVEFTASVPFARFPALKKIIESRKWWKRMDNDLSYFEQSWRPDTWNSDFRFIFIRRKRKQQQKGPLQLDLFAPLSYEFEYKVIVTNKKIGAKAILKFHNGRGSQEAIFAEAKSNTQLEYIPVKKLNGNKVYCLSAMLAHNLHREMQMHTYVQEYGTTAKRRPLWAFQSLATFRKNILQRAGRLIRPKGKLTLVLGANKLVQNEIAEILRTGKTA